MTCEDCGDHADHEFYEAETGSYSYACTPCLKGSRNRRLEQDAADNAAWADRMASVLGIDDEPPGAGR